MTVRPVHYFVVVVIVNSDGTLQVAHDWLQNHTVHLQLSDVMSVRKQQPGLLTYQSIKVTNESCRIFFFLRQQHTETNAAESRCRVQCKLITYQHLYRYVVHRGVFLGSIQECIHICMIPSHWHISGSRLVATDHTRWCLRRQYRHSIGSHANTRIVCSFYRWECTFAYNRHYCTCMRYLKQKIDIYEITSPIYVQRYRRHKFNNSLFQ